MDWRCRFEYPLDTAIDGATDSGSDPGSEAGGTDAATDDVEVLREIYKIHVCGQMISIPGTESANDVTSPLPSISIHPSMNRLKDSMHRYRQESDSLSSSLSPPPPPPPAPSTPTPTPTPACPQKITAQERTSNDLWLGTASRKKGYGYGSNHV